MFKENIFKASLKPNKRTNKLTTQIKSEDHEKISQEKSTQNF